MTSPYKQGAGYRPRGVAAADADDERYYNSRRSCVCLKMRLAGGARRPHNFLVIMLQARRLLGADGKYF